MSLKAKIEAVIYAAEEPVTLSQLVAVFASEIPYPEPEQGSLEWTSEPVSLLPDGAAHATAAGSAELSAEGVTSQAVITIDDSGFMHDTQPPSESFAAPGGGAELLETPPATTAAVVPVPAESELEEAARRTLRLRDREVRDRIREVVDELIADYALENRGIEIREIAGGFRMATKPEFHDAVRAFVKSLKPPMKLSLQALETLAVIAYKQPVTAPEVGEIRGVDSGGVLAGLISRKLVTTAGRKQVIGRPILYKTTKEFLMRFGLKDIAELPSMEEFEKMAVELAESDALEASVIEERAGVAPATEQAETESAPSPAQSGAVGILLSPTDGASDQPADQAEHSDTEAPVVSSETDATLESRES